jgi:superfamily II DNA or RNA helicase
MSSPLKTASEARHEDAGNNARVSVDRLLGSLFPGGKDFERLCKWLLENVPEYRSQLQRVWLWDEWPGRWGRDAGIDLVAEDHDGGLWAVQAKHYDPAYAIKKADLDSFLSESSRAGFTYRLLIATTDHLGPTARSTLAAQEKPVGVLLRSQLELLEVAWPTSITRLRPAKPKRKRPRPHQRRAINQCVLGLASADRGQLVMACGTGKTLVGPFLADQLGAKRVLVLVPSLSLLGQTLREWATAIEFDYLAVCSDDTVTKDEHDAVVASTSELGVPVTTDAERIASFLRRRGAERRVIFSTYQSSPQIAAAQAGRTPGFDLVIADEAHRCAGSQAGVFATVLDQTKIKARKRLFMTATPRYFTGRVKREASEADWEVASMDEEAKFGPVMHRLTFGQAIQQDLLSDYRVVVVGVTDDEALDLAARGAFVTHDGHAVTDARTLARQIGLLRAMAKHDLRRIVTFHSRIEYATRFASSLRETSAWLPARRRPSGDLWTDHVSGKMTAGERDVRLRRLGGVGPSERGVLTNARCLTEGVDVPTLDGVAFIDPRRSQVDVVQAVGRAIRKAEDKGLGTVVIPVLVSDTAQAEEVLESSEFDRVWEVVRALRTHDDQLADELDALRREQGRRGSVKGRPRKIVLDLPVGINPSFADAFDAIVVKRATTYWEEGLGAATAYRREHGHLRVKANYVTDTGFKLGSWIVVRRLQFREERLSPERVAQLNALDMIWDPLEADWRSAVAAAAMYRAVNGHLRVPKNYVAGDGFRLGGWVSSVRSKRNSLPSERVRELDALGMVWEPFDDDWRRALEAAKSFRESHGHLLVHPRFKTEDGLHLGAWITHQRSRRAKGSLTPEQIASLDELGMVWDPGTVRWETKLAAARRFHAAHGHLRVPGNFVDDDGVKLGVWVQSIRNRQDLLSAERRRQLDELGVEWDPVQAMWDRKVAAAREYQGVYGHLRVPPTYVTEDGIKLGVWIQSLRPKRTRLSAPQRAQLDELGMVWDAHEAGWLRGLSAAREYHELHGNLDVPTGFVTPQGFGLATWLTQQRSNHRKGKLPSDRRAELDRLDIDWEPRESKSVRGLASARRFFGEHAHLRVPLDYVDQTGFALGRWLSGARQRRRQESLRRTVVRELDELGMVWDMLDDEWQRAIAAARMYRAEHGDLRVPARYRTPNGFPLGQWISVRRLNRDRLSASRTRQLDDLGMVWDPFGEDWETGLSAARRFHDEHRHLRVRASYVTEDGFKLGEWVAARRYAGNKGRLAESRVKELDALGMVWYPREEDWERGLAAARAFHASHGNLNVPNSLVTEDGVRLRAWLQARAKEASHGKLASSRRSALDDLDPQWFVYRERRPRGEDSGVGAGAASSSVASGPP